MNALEIRDLTKHYGGFSLEHLNLTLPKGCIMGLVGENGAGKSTTIKLILNVIRRDGGTVTLLGKDNRENLALTKEDVGVVLDEVGISACLTARQVGRIMKDIYRNWDQAAFDGFLTRLAVPTDRKFKEFSRGMKMKLGIAIALSHHAKLLILDEATSGLDPVVRDEVMDIFMEFTRDEAHSILISSHIVSDLEKICDYIAFLHKGKLLLCEEKDRLKEEYGVLHCTPQEADAIPAAAVIGRKTSAYGCELLVKRDQVSGNPTFSPVDIEQLFIFMAKEEN
ncbi:MAG: ABC transporter ATP-binding protein [Firmicutes bacterium]|nr:ABC transporter ATP-binding protein [Bacillota bacterium]